MCWKCREAEIPWAEASDTLRFERVFKWIVVSVVLAVASPVWVPLLCFMGCVYALVWLFGKVFG